MHIEGYIPLESIEDTQDLLETLDEAIAGTIIIEPQTDWNDAIKGYHKPSNRLVYDGEKVIEIYQADGMTMDEAMDFASYNISFGELTPLIHYDWHDLEDLFDEGD
jgi:hypothetical protein